MPETDFILSLQEQEKLVEALFDQGMKFVPAMCYKTANYVELTNVKDVQSVASSDDLAGPIFVLSPHFSRYPLEIHPVFVKYYQEQRFFLTQRHGGPYLDLLPIRINSKVNPPILISGFVAYYKSYYIDADFTEVPAPAELKELYKFCVAWLRRSCKRMITEKGRRVYYVGPQAYHALKSRTMTTNAAGLRFE